MTHRPILLLAAAGLSLGLGGCGGTSNRGLESVHQPVVERAEYALDLRTGGGGGLLGGERSRLEGWFEAMGLKYGDRVSVDDPSGYASGAVADVSGVVAAHGLLVSTDAPVTATPVPAGAVRVVLSRMRASVPGCPDFSRSSSVDYESNTSSNFGCATNTNLAAMVANPGDLVRGKTGSATTDPASSGKAIEVYRKAVPTGVGGVKTESVGGK